LKIGGGKLMNLTDTYTLNNGKEIPVIGFGTWKMPEGEHTEDIVEQAINEGYRHIDTATNYGNETSVGRAIKRSGVDREDIFVTTKLQNPEHTYELAKKAIDNSLEYLGLDYIDLYLIHWPNPLDYRESWQKSNEEAWKAMEEAVEEGKIKTLGVSNFHPRHLRPLLDFATIKPAVNQIYLNPSDMQIDLVKFNQEHSILTEAYSPLSHGDIFNIEELNDMAKKYGKTTAQLILRWHLQHGFLPLPKTETPKRISENADVFDFEIEKLDMDRIDKLEGQAGKAKDPDQLDH